MAINRKYLVILLLIVAVLLPAVGACSSGEKSDGTQSAPRVGKEAPDFVLPSLDGEEIALSDYRGKPVLLNFWATWCSPCRIELPHLVSAYRGYADKELVVLAVDVGEHPSRVADFAFRFEVSLPVLLDVSGETASLYQVRAFPTNFLIDREGIIREVKIGAFRDVADVTKSLREIID